MKRKRKREEAEVGGRGAAALTEKRTHQCPQMTAAMELLHSASCLLLFLLFLLTRPGVTSADNNGPVKVKVTEGDDVVLPCSLRKTDLNYVVFDWKKDDQKEVFFYDSGIHYNKGRGGQDPQFKGRVSHFEDELQHGNASIEIRNTQLEDSGKYKCIFPRLQNQIFPIELVVDPVLKKRNTKGASPKPVVAILNHTNDWSLLQCEVLGASPKPTVEWRDSSGNVVPAKEPQVTERGGHYDIILQTTVTKTDRYRCVSTQEEINHQDHAETYVYISAPEPRSGANTGLIAGWTVAAIVSVVLVAVV